MTQCVIPTVAPVVARPRARRLAPSAPLRRVCVLQRAIAPGAAPAAADNDVDWTAVLQVADDGMRLSLRGVDRREAIRRMAGRIDEDLIAWRLCMPRSAVDTALSQLQ
ncbi:hypothetical protein P5V93_23550 [Mycobacteroides abscessus subsp. abscessus]|uniref:hypothetical protein n=1 Tax=Mycobacteroides abscessus TaxID=36809 RepID=UPI0002F5C4FA|nr:hypothetical protein [Mycobacteroides abscessus]MDO3101097.1 hypothetical protein [Mycobacteroides abscessus subsp. abscessus]MDO3185060.1 hypothetical protein [Mycobacteroides abscessus subsp. abscessus]MDO3194316.1 hypothetical protein [Mycobacteroides abscessus subsp. abscessus]MDO3287489.1 hypothetical protein [Mycobacteroides abscessus subsp. abscessus]OLT84775.1 hypothetical protein BKG58_16070 [Mycobacteroides abscessus subsp. abscessus]